MSNQEFVAVMMFLNLLSSAIIFFRGVFFVVNSMSKETYFPIRMAWVCLCTGALATLIGPLFGIFVASVHATLVNVGVSIFILCERRSPELASK